MIERLAASFATARLGIRLVEARDVDGLLAVHGDDAVTRFLPFDTWRSRDDADAWFARIERLHEEGRARQYVMVRASGGADIVGAVVVFNPDAANRRAEIGYALARASWGRGLMREAVGALVERAFEDLALHRLEAFVDPRNVASHRLLQSLGFRHEGRLRARGFLKGEEVDSDVYGLLRSERPSR